MEHKLRTALPPRAAWAVIGACVLFWVLSALGLLRLPASIPSLLTFFWLYLNALATLLSAMAAVAAVAALILHGRESRRLKRSRPASGPADTETAELIGLDRLLNPPPLRETGPPAEGQPAEGEQTTRNPRRKRKRR